MNEATALPRLQCHGVLIGLSQQQPPQLQVGAAHHPIHQAEAKLLQLLLQARGEVVSRQRILDEVWGNRLVSQSSINQLVSQLRALLSQHCPQQKLIVTVPKQGYCLDSRWLQATMATKPTKRSWSLWYSAAALLLGVAGMGLYADASVNQQRGTSWQRFGQLSVWQANHRYPHMDALLNALSDQFAEQTTPVSLLLMPMEQHLLFDCVYHRPAWPRQRQHSIELAQPKAMAATIERLCYANGGYQ